MFKDRKDAGIRLAKKLNDFSITLHPHLVIALPRGGVPVADEIAKSFDFPLDILIVKKVGHPFNHEYAMGAVTDTGVVFKNPLSTYNMSALDEEDLYSSHINTAQEKALKLRKGKPPRSLTNQEIILVDDGIATGATMEVAIKYLRTQEVKSITIAVPIAEANAIERLTPLVNQVIILQMPINFHSVSQAYLDFPQTEDEEVITILEKYS